VLLTDLLIKRSGYRLKVAEAGEDLNSSIEELAVSVARGELHLDDIIDWFKERIERM
jgi:hypothetical protein